MASAVQSLRLCLRSARQAPLSRNFAPRAYASRRALSTTPAQWRPAARKDERDEIDRLEDEEDDDDDDGGVVDIATMQKEYRRATRGRENEVEDGTRLQEQTIGAVGEIVYETQRIPTNPMVTRSFWNEDEDDPDSITNELNEDDFTEDDIPSTTHGKLEEIREYRDYARRAAWEMPLLSKLARPFEPPTTEEPLRFRFTTYMGEFHPAENKVVVEFSPRDMPLDEAQQLKMKKLLGPRYNPETDIAKMSCEQFEHQAQNKRYLGDLVNKLIETAKDKTDMFEDVPLDTRHHKSRPKPKFPVEWRMTEERRKFLEDTRQQALLLDQQKEEAGKLISGAEAIEKFFDKTTEQDRLPAHITASLERQLPPSPQGPRRFGGRI